ncbi:hypothetical protein NC652_009111 [Populus alba x Populus x berolinensis]|nr:hypothetical protein NC652_009111 [Populus alba x Populus x berolinensis]
MAQRLKERIAYLPKRLKGQRIRDLDGETVIVLTSFGKKGGYAVESKQLEGHTYHAMNLSYPQLEVSKSDLFIMFIAEQIPQSILTSTSEPVSDLLLLNEQTQLNLY